MSPSLPKTYKAAVFAQGGAEKLEFRDVELKLPGPGEVLIKVKACGVCFGDDAMRKGFMHNTFPRVPGHELVGDIAALGPDVHRFEIGQRVGAPWHGGKQWPEGICCCVTMQLS
jgi:D-arabinose 1-dehydrogenase-like Zn-dependent alcohol dehydrogenase